LGSKESKARKAPGVLKELKVKKAPGVPRAVNMAGGNGKKPAPLNNLKSERDRTMDRNVMRELSVSPRPRLFRELFGRKF
jgi:hypothetical protein